MIYFIIGLVIGYLLASARFAIALKSNPEQFKGLVETFGNHLPQEDTESFYVYIEKDGSNYFAYSLPKNTYEGMARSEDELIEIVCNKYPNRNIEVMHAE